MIWREMNKFAAIRTFVLAALFAIAFAATTTHPSFAATSGTSVKTGSLNTGRYSHSTTLLQNGQVLVAGGLATTPEDVLAGAPAAALQRRARRPQCRGGTCGCNAR